jgi:hypothetical protein
MHVDPVWVKFHELVPGDHVVTWNQTQGRGKSRVLVVDTIVKNKYDHEIVWFHGSGKHARKDKFGCTYHLCRRMRHLSTDEVFWVVNEIPGDIYILKNGRTVRGTSKQWETVEPTDEEIEAYNETQTQIQKREQVNNSVISLMLKEMEDDED